MELRRLRFDLFFYYKVFNHLTPFDPDLVFTIYSPPNCLRSNEPFILKPITVPNKFLSSTFYRAVDAWNYLPIGLRLSNSLPAFKSSLKVVDFSKFLKRSVNLNWLNVLPFCVTNLCLTCIWSGVLVAVSALRHPVHALLYFLKF